MVWTSACSPVETRPAYPTIREPASATTYRRLASGPRAWASSDQNMPRDQASSGNRFRSSSSTASMSHQRISRSVHVSGSVTWG